MVRASSIDRNDALGWVAELVFPDDRATADQVPAAMERESLSIGRRVSDSPDQTMERASSSSIQERLRQARKMETIGRSASAIAHDFNNILGAIAGYARLLAEDLADEESRNEARGILGATKRGEELVEQLLAFCRPTRPDSELADPVSSVKQMCALLRAMVGSRVRLHVRSSAVPPVRIEPCSLKQIVMNLAINARDAMPDGGTLTIAITGTPDEKGSHAADELRPGYVGIAVSDTGTGMSQEVAESAFEPFFTTKPEGEGTGLGLATVDALARAGGGRVSLDSQIGRGTTVTVLLPAAGTGPTRNGEAGCNLAIPVGNPQGPIV